MPRYPNWQRSLLERQVSEGSNPSLGTISAPLPQRRGSQLKPGECLGSSPRWGTTSGTSPNWLRHYVVSVAYVGSNPIVPATFQKVGNPCSSSSLAFSGRTLHRPRWRKEFGPLVKRYHLWFAPRSWEFKSPGVHQS